MSLQEAMGLDLEADAGASSAEDEHETFGLEPAKNNGACVSSQKANIAKPAGKGKAKAKAKSTGKRKGNKAALKGEEDGAWKKCVDCEQFLEASCFHADQCKCKTCFNNRRCYGRLCTNQKATDMVKDIELKDPKQAKCMFKSFSKHKAREDKEAAGVKFSIYAFMQEWSSSEGRRKAAEYEMMWEGEWMEFSRTAKAGYLTKEEAEKKWLELKQSEEVARDESGPRGFLRLAIKVKDVLTQFEEVKRSQVAQRSAKYGKYGR